MAQNEQFRNASRDNRGERGGKGGQDTRRSNGRGGQGGRYSSGSNAQRGRRSNERSGQGGRHSDERDDFRGRDSRKGGSGGRDAARNGNESRGASRSNGAPRGNGGTHGDRNTRGNGAPRNNRELHGAGARGDVEMAAAEPAFEPLPAQYPLMVGSIDGGRKVEVLCRDKGADQFAARLRKVAKDRRKWARDNDISCYRVYDADLPDFAVAIDRYDGVWKSEGENCLVIAEYQAPKSIDAAKAAARLDDAVEIASATLGIPRERVFLKTRRREKGGGQYTDQQKEGHVLYTQESGNVFECDLGSYLDTGIFLDHRVTREMVGSMAEGKSFLNLFSYTGTCTVHAAVGGAKSTLTVALSQTSLSWAHRNMELNGCDGPEHGFVRADVLQWIEREARGWRRFDLIFVDPPTFSNSKAMGKNTWSVQRDHVKLLTNVVRLLERDGVAVFSCNLRNFKPDVEALAEAGVAIEDITPQTIPHDFERNAKIHCCYLVRKA